MVLTACVFMAASLYFSTIHLFFCYKLNEKMRKLTKVLCVAFLSLSLIFFAPSWPLIYLGTICGFIGDYFLIKKEKMRYLMAGIILFFIGHIFYILQLMIIINSPIWGYILYIGLSLFLIVLGQVIFYPKLKYLTHNSTNLGIAYFVTMTSALILSIISISVLSNALYLILVIFGYVLFIISDSTLLYTTYIKHYKRADFYIMLTYLAAQYLITIGLVLTLAQY